MLAEIYMLRPNLRPTMWHGRCPVRSFIMNGPGSLFLAWANQKNWGPVYRQRPLGVRAKKISARTFRYGPKNPCQGGGCFTAGRFSWHDYAPQRNRTTFRPVAGRQALQRIPQRAIWLLNLLPRRFTTQRICYAPRPRPNRCLLSAARGRGISNLCRADRLQ
jgi:hypothetical protein